ncbi:MAG: FAD-binding protein [Clostridia bacterium]|nr:FAD-binding protein [Clostridia bacterium]
MYKWQYENKVGEVSVRRCRVLVLGGGMAGAHAAVGAAEALGGQGVILVDKANIAGSGAAGSGVDHWEMACTNPCCRVSPEEMAYALIREQDGYSNGIAHYIECREGWDRLRDLEAAGAKIRDTDDEFVGAPFRDDKTKLMFAYDYDNKYTLRVWGTGFKPALRRRATALGVTLLEYTEASSLIMSEDGKSVRGAILTDIHTGMLHAVLADAVVLAMSRPARIWLFDPDVPGLSEFRPLQCVGSGHAMGWRAGVEFTMMEKSVRAEYSAAGRSFPTYSAGNNHNTWYAASIVDSEGRELPYLDRDGNEIPTVDGRYRPAKGQKFFLKGGVIDEAKYEFRGPETISFGEAERRGYKPPFYADLSRMPEYERRVIFGMMVGEEGKTKIPVYDALTRRDFDPARDMLRVYGTGWKSASFSDDERQLFGAPGGVLNDWELMTNIGGLFAAGDQLFASDCAGFAAATGHYAGRHAAKYALAHERSGDAVGKCETEFIKREAERLYAPLFSDGGADWRELNRAASKLMRRSCGAVKSDALLTEGLSAIDEYRREAYPKISCSNPHELMRAHEVSDILDVCELILYSSLARRKSCAPLCFERADDELSADDENAFIVTRRGEDGNVISRTLPHGYFGDLAAEYEAHNKKGGAE